MVLGPRVGKLASCTWKYSAPSGLGIPYRPGSSPYPGIAGRDIHKLIRNGYRMDKPENCSQQIYQLMMSCWEANPKDRPSFTDLRNDLEKMLEADDEWYISVNCDDFDYYSNLASNVTSSSEDEQQLVSAMSTEANPFM